MRALRARHRFRPICGDHDHRRRTPDTGGRGTTTKFLYAAVPIVLTAALWFGLPYLLDSTTGIGAAPVGTCLAQTEPGDPNSALEVRDCSDPTAT